MGKATIILYDQASRDKAVDWIRRGPSGTRVEFRASKRTIPQNDRMWAMLTDIAEQITHFEAKMDPDDWKVLCMEQCGHDMRPTPSLDGKRLVGLGHRSSKMSKDEMSELIEFIFSYGAEHDVQFNEPGE